MKRSILIRRMDSRYRMLSFHRPHPGDKVLKSETEHEKEKVFTRFPPPDMRPENTPLFNLNDLPPPSEYGDAVDLVPDSLKEFANRDLVNEEGACFLEAGLPFDPPLEPPRPRPPPPLPPPLRGKSCLTYIHEMKRKGGRLSEL